MGYILMICPVCLTKLQLIGAQEETWETIYCICDAYRVECWNFIPDKEAVFITLNSIIYQIVFDHAQHNTQIYVYNNIDICDEITTHLFTLPEIKTIPDITSLTESLKVWLTFS